MVPKWDSWLMQPLLLENEACNFSIVVEISNTVSVRNAHWYFLSQLKVKTRYFFKEYKLSGKILTIWWTQISFKKVVILDILSWRKRKEEFFWVSNANMKKVLLFNIIWGTQSFSPKIGRAWTAWGILGFGRPRKNQVAVLKAQVVWEADIFCVITLRLGKWA